MQPIIYISSSVPDKHLALGTRTTEPFPDDTEMVSFGMGCFWGAERKFWQTKGVYSTQVICRFKGRFFVRHFCH